MQMPRILKVRRQVNPAAFSGLTDQISGLGQSAGNKAKIATSGLSKTQTTLVVIFVTVAFLLAVAAIFWLCSCSRRRKRAREMRHKSDQMQSLPSSNSLSSTAKADRSSNRMSGLNDGWAESRLALNSSFVSSTNDSYAWNQSQAQLPNPSMPRAPQQPFRY
ncbi:hypothetical protein NDA11_002140 [Ustilago hordei]|uniref:Uncharacterized protein n=1 Tax=Ustilago hordei TaxID=120017 RepID=I2FQ98_USTHO|nr:uncharacterized protein UHO2_06272 [Ustilago hordei]KAJ1038525.1 hypothetical protein NDA10_002433 [Ustilago hordei]KAJ1570297.1 hypothetical protein NDA15_000475 [Ustilago hordei]KAJ1571797.1 hypothetical protein NDA12_003682 [Ustilago hordei]KAJ1575899.1 hypothetical protein NDA11_002140 [Ustilago hordei]KAJ1604217.1 hypothetical protein NDA14_005894 [Ustilago hordei]